LQNERRVLISALIKAENSGYSNIVLNSVLGETNLDPLKTSFVTAVFYGVLEKKMALDFVLNKYLKKPIAKAPPFTAAVLRSGVYQILFMKKVPDSAAVNEGVKLIKKSKENGNSGLVNAVLRRVSTEKSNDLLKNAESHIKYSVSKEIYNALSKDYGKILTENFLENSLNPPPVFVKLNTIKGSSNEIISELKNIGIKVELTGLSDSFILSGMGSIEKIKAYKLGEIFVQDFSSTLCAKAVNAEAGMRVLDVCAAPGGKSFSMAIDMKNRGEIISCDIHEHRVKLISDGAKRLGLTCIKPKLLDATDFDGELGQFDRVLCDVPCSGIGVIRRKPEIKYKNMEELNGLPELQFKILSTAAKYLKRGGRLVYSTCTLFKKENGAVVEKFLKENTDFALTEIGVLDIKEYTKTFIPPESLGDGFFIAALERK
jgi:16S rRNA (cytosine967-C5)-methyltransferase